MSQTLGETMMASFMASTKEIPDIFILVVVEGFTPLGPDGASIQQSQPEQVNRGKQRKVEYERPYPERTTEQERRGEGPDRPKRKRVDGNVCYANSGEGSKRRCDATGRPPGRPPG